MAWRLFCSLSGWAGFLLAPALLHQKKIRRVVVYAGQKLVAGGTILMSAMIILAPLFGLVAQMTPQERNRFDEMERRMRRVEQIVTKIDDPDGLLRSLNDRTRTLEAKLSDAELGRVRLEAKIDRNNEKLDDLWKWGALMVTAVMAAFRLFDWVKDKVKEVANKETGEKPVVK